MSQELFFNARVVEKPEVIPAILLINFGGDNLRRFTSTAHPEEWVSLHFPCPAKNEAASRSQKRASANPEGR